MTRFSTFLILFIFAYSAYAQLVVPKVEDLQPLAERKKEEKDLNGDLDYLKLMLREHRQNIKENPSPLVVEDREKTVKKQPEKKTEEVAKEKDKKAEKKKEPKPAAVKEVKKEKDKEAEKKKEAAQPAQKPKEEKKITLDKKLNNLRPLPPVNDGKIKEEPKIVSKKKKKKIETVEDLNEPLIPLDSMVKVEEPEEDLQEKDKPGTMTRMGFSTNEKDEILEEFKTSPMIFTRARMLISPMIPINSYDDFAEVSLLVEVERGQTMFPPDITIHDEIAEGEGILFIFDKPGLQVISLNNLFIARDFVFLDVDGRVVELRRKVRNPDNEIVTFKPVASVLQLSDGGVKKYGIKIGDRARLESDVNFFK